MPARPRYRRAAVNDDQSRPVRILLTGAGGSAAENVLDALRMAPGRYHVVGADVSPVKLHLSSATERFVLPRADDDRYLEAVCAAVQEFRIDVVHAQPDVEVRALAAARDRIGAATLLPSLDAITKAGDKAVFARAMQEAGVAVPDTEWLGPRDDISDVVARLRQRHERVWVRARVGAGSRASLPVSTPEQAAAWVDWWVSEKGMGPGDFMASEMLPGREFAYQSIWQSGRLVAGQARERLEYLYGFLSPSGQSSTPAVARTVREPAIDELAQKAILALDQAPSGVYCVDIKEASDGAPKVTEINCGRFFTTSNFFATAGLNMPDMAMRAATGETLPALGSSPLEAGLHWIRMVDMGYRLVVEAELDAWIRLPR